MSRQTLCVDCNTSAHGVRCRTCYAKSQRHSLPRQERQRWWTIKQKYNMTPDDFWCYWIAQHGQCYICTKTMEQPKMGQRGQNLDACCIDHDHQTNQVRALLCGACNKGIGFLKDDPNLIQKALEYLTI